MNRSRVFALSIGFFSAECGKYYGSGSQITKRCRQSYCGHKLTNKNYFASNYYRKKKNNHSTGNQSISPEILSAIMNYTDINAPVILNTHWEKEHMCSIESEISYY